MLGPRRTGRDQHVFPAAKPRCLGRQPSHGTQRQRSVRSFARDDHGEADLESQRDLELTKLVALHAAPPVDAAIWQMDLECLRGPPGEASRPATGASRQGSWEGAKFHRQSTGDESERCIGPGALTDSDASGQHLRPGRGLQPWADKSHQRH